MKGSARDMDDAARKVSRPALLDADMVAVPQAAYPGFGTARLRDIRQGMFAEVNTERGSARSARIEAADMIMAGKTGTSRVRNITSSERDAGVVANDDLPWARRDHALSVALAPYEVPKYAVSVVAEHGGGASAVAAPIARDIVLRALNGGVPPLGACPAAQRSRVEAQQNALKLRLSKAPAATRSASQGATG